MESLIKSKLLVDVDGVILNLMTPLNNWVNSTYNESFRECDYRSYALEKTWKCSRAEATKRVMRFYETKDFYNTPAFPEAPKVIEKLSKWYDPIIVTAIPLQYSEVRIEQLRREFGNLLPKKNIFITGFGSNGNGPGALKAKIARKKRIKKGIEDSRDNARDLAREADMEVYLVARSYNVVRKPTKGVIRVPSLEEILRIEKFS